MPVEKLTPTFTFTEDRLQALQAVVPEAFADGQVNWETLKEALGACLADEGPGTEHFGLFWPGKRQARRLAAQPSKGTLRPVKGEGVNEDSTDNLFIEGDNLEVLKLLQKSYAGRVKLIYIDPPYNTGNDFVYKDDFREPLDSYLQKSGQADAEGLLTSNPKAGGRFHSNWLNMMLPRLMLARTLLTEDGVIFVSIDDNEVGNLRILMDEIFGEENFISSVIWQKKYTRSNDATWFSDNHDYIIVYAKSSNYFNLNLEERSEKQISSYSNPDNHPKGPWKATPIHAKSGTMGEFSYRFKNGVVWSPPKGTYPRYSKETLKQLDDNDEVWFGRDNKSTPARKSFLSGVKAGVTPVTIWQYDEVGHTHEANNQLKELNMSGIFNNPKPTRLVSKILKLTTLQNGNDIILDFFSGSSTTAQAVLELNREDGGNRRFIMVQMPEPTPKDSAARQAGYQTIADIGKERIRRVIAKLQKQPVLDRDPPEDLGFAVYKLDRSHFKAWQDYDGPPDPAALDDLFSRFEDPLIDGWQPRALLDEILLLQGFPLDSQRTRLKDFKYNAIVHVECDWFSFRLFVCLDATIQPATIAQLQLQADDKFICLDSALTDQLRQQLADRCKLTVL
jgi:adenine-specific DNA-methyltransferase